MKEKGEREREREKEKKRELTGLNKIACCCKGVNSYPAEQLVGDIWQWSEEVQTRRPVGIAPKAVTYTDLVRDTCIQMYTIMLCILPRVNNAGRELVTLDTTNAIGKA